MSVVGRLVVLVAIWLLAWGEVRVVHALVGSLLAALLLVAFPMAEGTPLRFRTGIRPLGVLELVGYLLWQLVRSNVLVARQILSPRSRVRTGVITYEMRSRSDWVTTLVANIIALTPGTMTVDATRDPHVLTVHFLLLDDEQRAHDAIATLERLVVGAVGGTVPA